MDAQLHAQAAEHLKKSRFSQAIELYRQLLSDNPENPELRAELAEAYRRSNNGERAFHHFNRAAALYNLHGRPELELKMLDLAMSVSPKEPDILYRRAECLRTLGRADLLRAALLEVIEHAKSKGDRRRLWALEQLHAANPDDPVIAFRRAEALAEADRIDDAVHAFKHISARFGPRNLDFVRLLKRAAEIAVDRPDIGADIAAILLTHGYARESLATLVPFYERFSDDVRILEVLLGVLVAMGAVEKILPARIELLKARAKVSGSPENAALGIAEADSLMSDSADQPVVLEVVAHSFVAFNAAPRAIEAWRRMARAADRAGMAAERDRAVLSILRADQDDEEALELGKRSLLNAGRESEALAFDKRLKFVRAKRRKEAEQKQQAAREQDPIARSESPTRAGSIPKPLVAPRAFSAADAEDGPPESRVKWVRRPDTSEGPTHAKHDDHDGPEAVFTQEQSLPTAAGIRPRLEDSAVRPSPWDPPSMVSGELQPIDTNEHTDSSDTGSSDTDTSDTDGSDTDGSDTDGSDTDSSEGSFSAERGTLSLEEADVLEVRASADPEASGSFDSSFDVEVSLDELEDEDLPSDPALTPARRISSEISTGEFDEERPTELSERYVAIEMPVPRTISLDVPIDTQAAQIVEILPARSTTGSNRGSSGPKDGPPRELKDSAKDNGPLRRHPSLSRPIAAPVGRGRTRPPPALSSTGRPAPTPAPARPTATPLRRPPSIAPPRSETAPIRANTPTRPPTLQPDSVEPPLQPGRIAMPAPPTPLARTDSDTQETQNKPLERTTPGVMDELDFDAFPELAFEPEEITSKIEALIEEQTIGLDRPVVVGRPREVTQPMAQAISPRRLIDDLLD